MAFFGTQRAIGDRFPTQQGWVRDLTLLSLAAICLPARAISPEELEFFESKIRPVIAQECYECHNSKDKARGGLVLDTRDGWQKGGESGPAIVPGRPADSLFIRSIKHLDDDLKMPKAGAKLEPETVAVFEKWIALGAPDPRDQPPSEAELARDTSWEAIRGRRQNWWSFLPIAPPEPPALPGVEDPVDRFLRAKSAAQQLPPASPADPRALIRRLYFNLIGLPPRPEEVERFAAEMADARVAEAETPGAEKRVVAAWVDRLLADPAFGEKWARHWMDWVRYADSHGSEGDPDVPNAWMYRDYLIRALNADIPYDQLVMEHFAGDLLDEPRVDAALGLNESALGIGHLRMVYHGFAPTDALEERVRFTDDQIGTVTRAFLGLTVACSRCHNHKFDPVSQRDYYALYGVFSSARPALIAVNAPGTLGKNRDDLAKLKPRIRAAVAEAWIAAAESLPEKLTSPEWRAKTEDAIAPDRPLHALRLVSREIAAGRDPAAAWNTLRETWAKDRAALAEHRRRAYRLRWDGGSEADYAQWFPQGEGLGPKPAKAGEFSVSTENDDLAIGRIFPASTLSHALSTRHRAVLASPDIVLDGEYDLWLRVAGDGGASARYAVQNYPRSGTVYPVTSLSGGDWRWVKYEKLDYWDGDRVHVELATNADQPLLADLGRERSWWAVREAVLFQKGSPPPPVIATETLDPVFAAAARSGAPETVEAAAALLATAVRDAATAWRDGSPTDAQALLLDAWLRLGALPNRPGELGKAGPLLAEYRRLEAEVPVAIRAPGLAEWRGADAPLFVRGDHKQPADTVPRRFLEAIDETPYATDLSGRLEFARDLLRPDNPLTARVIVNRLWHHLFGRGLAPTTGNFGRLGEKPDHPELLDFLAARFSNEQGWSLKRAIRDLVLTETWRQSSAPSPEAAERDPDNRLLTHFPVRRLDAEAIRDNLLAVSGALDRGARFGPPGSGTSPRRSLYVLEKRNTLDPLLTVFDMPEPAGSVGRRDVTNVPAQSLTLLNDPFIIGQARSWARRTLETLPDSDDDEDARIAALFETGFSRPPTPAENAGARAFLARLEDSHRESARRIAALESSLSKNVAALSALVEPVRKKLEDARKKSLDSGEPVDLKPLAVWDFEKDANDSAGELHAAFRGSARLEGGALVADGRGFAATSPGDRDLGAKTLEARVLLHTLDQRAGGVMTVQDLAGGAFDSIVFAERQPNEWLAGSNTFTRTLDFGGPKETEAAAKPVHLALVYRADGTILAYRNGEPHGQPVRKSGLHVFKAGAWQVVFGLRHGTAASGNRPLRGNILEARLYDRALEPGEVRAAATGDSRFVSEHEVLDSLTDSQRAEKDRLETEAADLRRRLETLRGEAEVSPPEVRKWEDLAHALFNLKEFIYVR
ncbi:MAG: DUF1553 domain-containing protein [Verrucomicrobiae bacterium]|nr:DUF1553 domain-containing protein [Verrucomicrobiae bacterium]